MVNQMKIAYYIVVRLFYFRTEEVLLILYVAWRANAFSKKNHYGILTAATVHYRRNNCTHKLTSAAARAAVGSTQNRKIKRQKFISSRALEIDSPPDATFQTEYCLRLKNDD